MKSEIKLPVAGLLLTTPLAAYADGIPHIEALYAFGGGAIGGFLGALVACWLCKRIRGSSGENDSRK